MTDRISTPPAEVAITLALPCDADMASFLAAIVPLQCPCGAPLEVVYMQDTAQWYLGHIRSSAFATCGPIVSHPDLAVVLRAYLHELGGYYATQEWPCLTRHRAWRRQTGG